MNIPSLPLVKFLKEDGSISDPWALFFDQLVQMLQTNLSDESYILPQQADSKLPDLTTLIGGTLYDSTNNLFKVNINGVWKTVTVT